MSRHHLLVPRMVERFALNLSGRIVLTEAASGAYRLNPHIAAMAGAKVYCVVKDSRFAKKEEVAEQLYEDAKALGVQDAIEVVSDVLDAPLSDIDIVTNSGFVRPIDKRLISRLNKQCVISLMWETWEFRDSDFDLQYCKQNDILCLGTNESVAPLDMDSYAGILAVRLLFDLQLEVYKNQVVLIGENRFSRRIFDYLNQVGADVYWFSNDTEVGEGNIFPREFFIEWFSENGLKVDAILLADLVNDEPYTSDGNILSPIMLKGINPYVRIGVLAGVVDTDRLRSHELFVYPHNTMPAHFMSYQLYDIGPTPIMELYAAGLKVGQIMSALRHSGLTPKEAALASLKESSLVMDFEGELAWT